MIVAGLVLVLALWPLDDDDGGWDAGGTSGQWEWGLPTTGPVGPDRAWGTNLDGLALNDSVDFVEIPIPDLSGAERPVLVLHHWYAFGPGDGGVVEVDSGEGWQVLPPAYGYPDALGFTGASADFVEHAFPLEDHLPSPRVRLLFSSDESLAGPGWYVDGAGLYDGDVVAPRITPVIVPTDTIDLVGPYPIVVAAVDDRALVDVRLVVSIDGGPEVVTSLAPDGGDTFRGQVGGQPPGTAVAWRVEADDGEQVARFPAEEDSVFRVFLPAPRDLHGATGRLIGDKIGLQWSPPESAYPITGYEVVDDHGGRTSAQVPFASVPVSSTGEHTWTVRAWFALDDGPVLGDPSEPVTLDVEVPALDPLVPDAAGPGERLWVAIGGQSLYLESTVADLDLGEGVAVEAIDVLDAERALVRVHVADDAAPGPRDVRLTGAQGTFRFARAFDVLDAPVAGSEAVVTPSVLFQGRPTSVTVTTPTPLEGTVSVDPGSDLVLTGDVLVEGEKVRFDLLAPLGSAPGPRTLLVEDGVRVYGADIVVRESITELPGPCAVAPGPFPGAALFGLALVAFRRRRSVGPC